MDSAGTSITAVGTELLETVTARFAECASRSELVASVPSCPDWTVEDLVRHIGEVHLWAASAVRLARAITQPSSVDVPAALLADWYQDTARHLIDTVSNAGTDGAAWVFAPSEGLGTTGFWIRRQIHETNIHTWDLLAARGATADFNLSPEIAWDGVQEVRDLLYPRQVRLGRTVPLPAALVLEATDVDCPPATIGSGKQIHICLPAVDILLLWRRQAPDLPPKARRLLSSALTP